MRKVSLAAIMCDGSYEVTEVSPLSFMQSDPVYNPRVSCKVIPRINLNAWKEEESEDEGEDYRRYRG